MVFGDPPRMFHPVRKMGWMIEKLEKMIRTVTHHNQIRERIGGGILVLVMILTWTGGSVFLLRFFYQQNLWLGIGVEGWICYRMLAMKSLKVESKKVYTGLSHSVEEGRYALSRIVGRDTSGLEEEGIIKATVETVAENTSDGVVAPLFYMLWFGGVGGVFYKVVNTMDSMIGYKNESYRFFGTAAAKLDDVLNFFPARISAYLLLLSSFFLGADWKKGWEIYRRDGKKHPSPNAGQTEAAMAGVLQVELAGDAIYFGKLHHKPKIGDRIREIERRDILRSHALLYGTGGCMFLCTLILRGLLWKMGMIL